MFKRRVTASCWALAVLLLGPWAAHAGSVAETTDERVATVAADEGLAAQTREPSLVELEQQLDQVIRKMRRAERQLHERRADQTAVELQEQIVRELERLVEAQAGARNSAGGDDNLGDGAEPGQAAGRGSGRVGAGTGGTLADAGGAQQADAAVPGGERRIGTPRSGELDRTDRIAGDARDALADDEAGGTTGDATVGNGVMRLPRLWGRLPPGRRTVLEGTFPQQFLPEYRAQIRAYFDRLAGEELLGEP